MTKPPRKCARSAPGRKKISKTASDKARRKKLEGELDDLWKRIIKAFWHYKCGWPGCNHVDGIAAHHYIHKAQGNRARWNVDNGIALDFYHHIQVVHRQGYVEPVREAIISKIGQERFDKLLENVREPWKPTLDELEYLKEEFSATLRLITNK